MPAPLLATRGLTVQRDNLTLLHPLDWVVRRHEHWVILGPNGCGKTTLLKALAGYLSATGGEMAVLGQVYGECDWRDLRRWLGVVSSSLQASIPPAEAALDTVISGRYAQLDLWATPTAADRREARRWLKFLEAGEIAERPWLYLSQGERQRVLIARALMARPRLLILDEPCTGLDPVARAHFLKTLDRLARRRSGPGLLLVTHHLDEIPLSFTHALLLRRGSSLAQGPIKKVLTARWLSRTFETPVRVRRDRRGWKMEL